MILTDTGPLVAIFDPSEGNEHRRCVDALKTLSKPLVSTLPCVTETMYILGKTWGWYGQFRLWHMIQNEIVDVFNLERDHLLRMSELMKKFSDTPMDFADASLVAAAEALGTNKIFTLDSDFYVYRMNGRKHFEIIP